MEIDTIITETILAPADSIQINLKNPEFLENLKKAAELLKDSPDRIITTGMGKSGLIARKVAATLTSTGSPAVFLHPADALHGDMGNIRRNEVILAFSNSGETREIVELLPHIRFLGNKLIAVTQNKASTLSTRSDVAVIFAISKEGCPLNLAPMASTSVSLTIGDALSAALIHLKKFQKTDFGKFHPSGSLGKKLLTVVDDVMEKNVETFCVDKQTDFKKVLSAMVSSNMGAVIVLGSKGHLRGIITDGDLKRLLDKFENRENSLFNLTADEMMTKDPIWVDPNTMVERAMEMMQNRKVYTLPVLDDKKKPVGLVRMHDIVAYL